ncbi:MAG TPA: ABC transporter permease [Phycisphaerae bacterium]|nr:ABC transporter permease [Phycisphaerae bacterium]HRY67004.1 ABC transporter permease [Phycisphaerae bacterium]HSA28843.1 ABC transporter permease [Phycisphaerae bacterium]
MSLPLSYHWRNLFVRRSTTLLTLLVIAAVVAVFCWMLNFAAALRGSLAMASDGRKLIVLKRGATAESNSALVVDEVNRLSQLDGVEHDSTGHAILSPEMVVQVLVPRIRDGGRTSANVAVRGVTEDALKVHRNVRLLGPMFSTAEPQVIVGTGAARQFAGLEVGQTIKLGYGGSTDYRIVAHFSADGGPMESEIWGYLPAMMNAYNRTMYSSVNLRLSASADPKAALAQIEGPAIGLSGRTEPDYWEAQARFVRIYLAIAYVLVAIMCVAAVFSVANTLFSSVAGRTQEIAMLRTIGFSRGQILIGFVVEAILLSLLGGGLGCVACAAWLGVAGGLKDVSGASTFSSMAFVIRMVPGTVVAALLSVAAVGAIGAIVPAFRASRIGMVSALREA